jgi:hypothetical protein
MCNLTHLVASIDVPARTKLPRFAHVPTMTWYRPLMRVQPPLDVVQLPLLLCVPVQQGVALALQRAGLRRRAALRRLRVAQPLC